MKRIIAAFLTVCTLLCTGSFAAETSEYTNRDIIEKVGKNISTFGVYGDFDSERLYLETLAGIMDKHPEMHDEILKELLSSTDKYGAYYTAAEAKQMFESLSDNITGIGVTVTDIDGNLIVSRVHEGTPAMKAGIKEGDIIVSADGKSLAGMELDTAVSYIKGTEGTSVSVTVRRGGTEMNFVMTREAISTEPLEYEILDENIGYICIYSFSTNTSVYFANALEAFSAKGIKNIIIDVRNNGGGYFAEAVAIADMLLPEGKVITTEDKRIDALDYSYIAKGKDPGYNIVILINEYSASASEVLCAALTENEAATSIGENSYGKGTVQTMVQLPDGGIMKYTTAFYLTPSGNNIDGKGLAPNIYVENTTEPVDMSRFTELKYKNIYRVGMTDPEIKYAKEMLSFLGIYYGEINEYYDENMRIAVTALQKATGYVAQTGELDPVTQIELLKILSEAEVVADNQLEEAKLYFTEE